jgi:guanine deaminase
VTAVDPTGRPPAVRRAAGGAESCASALHAPLLCGYVRREMSAMANPGPAGTPDERLLRKAIRLARTRMREGRGGPFGAVVARDGVIVARGWNSVTTSLDPTAHAEVVAIRRACRTLGTFHLEGCVLYSSCEPCPMCLAAAYWARVDRLLYAATRDDAARAGFDDAFIYDQVPLAPEARTLPTDHLLRAEAIVVFDEWLAKPDRVPY